jgi:2-aminoadipate transaminase
MSNSASFSQRAQWAAGQPISQLMHLALANPELVSLAAGFVDQESLPCEATDEAVRRVLADRGRARAALQYGTTPGYAPLRKAVLNRMLAADHSSETESNLSLDQVVMTAGSNQLLHLLAETLLDPGDIVLCAAPSYFVFLGIIGNLGARSIGVATDSDGLIPEALDDELSRLDKAGELGLVKAIYVVSYFDNPGSTTLPADRRAKIVEIAERWSRRQKIYVIEDAAYRELRYSGDDIPSLRSFDPRGETVVVAETFSKSFSPGIRVGWGIMPAELVEPVCALKGNIDFGSPNFSQHVMAEVLDAGLFEPHIAELRKNYRLKMTAMLEAAEQFLRPLPGVDWLAPSGGLYVWLRLPRSIDAGPSGPLLQTAMDHGVLYVPGEYCFPAAGEPIRKNMIRLSFGVQSPANIGRGIEALARAIEAVLQEAAVR